MPPNQGIFTGICLHFVQLLCIFKVFLFFYDSMKSKLLLRYILTVPRVPAVLEYRYYFKIRALRAAGACPLLWARIRKEFCESDQAESRAVVLMYLS